MTRYPRQYVFLVLAAASLLVWRFFLQDASKLIAISAISHLIEHNSFPRNLSNPTLLDYSQNGQSRILDDLFGGKTGGFFVEAGAYNGEELSNTLYFEKERGWTGLLIEPDPWNYYALRKRKRNVYSIQCCLSNSDALGQTVDFKQSDTMGRIVSAEDRRKIPGIYATVRCFPLDLILRAIGRTSIDLLSLDVEGHEIDVLSSFPFDEIDVRVICVEFRHSPDGRVTLANLLQPHGYSLVREIGDDLIFTKK